MPSLPNAYSFQHQLLISLPTKIHHEITCESIIAKSLTVNQIMHQALIIERGAKAELYYSPQHSHYAKALKNQPGTLETQSEYFSGTWDSANDHESDCSMSTSSSTVPWDSNIGETIQNHANTWDSADSDDSDDSMSISSATSSQSHSDPSHA